MWPIQSLVPLTQPLEGLSQSTFLHWQTVRSSKLSSFRSQTSLSTFLAFPLAINPIFSQAVLSFDTTPFSLMMTTYYYSSSIDWQPHAPPGSPRVRWECFSCPLHSVPGGEESFSMQLSTLVRHLVGIQLLPQGIHWPYYHSYFESLSQTREQTFWHYTGLSEMENLI